MELTILIGLLSVATQVHAMTDASQSPKIELREEIKSEEQVWLDKLRKCESGGDDKARNPKDLDGTESLGRYQFKRGTFDWLSGKYKIATTSIWNGEEQELIVRKMIRDKSVNITKQFPDCTTNPKVKNFAGLPPLLE